MYRAGIALFLICFFAVGNAHSATAINLDIGVTDNERYGNGHPRPFTRITDELQASFVLERNGPTYVSVVGYDIDSIDEVSMTLDGGITFFLEAVKVNNGYSPTVRVNLGDLPTGNHTLVIKNAINRNYKWGVTDLLIAQEGGGGSDHAIALLTELGCEVGQIIRATTLGWECVEEHPCPESIEGTIAAILSYEGSSAFEIDEEICIIQSDIPNNFSILIERGDDWPYWPRFFYSDTNEGVENYKYDFHHYGEFESCMKPLAESCPCFANGDCS